MSKTKEIMHNEIEAGQRGQLSLNPNEVELFVSGVNSKLFAEDVKKAYKGNKAAIVRSRVRLKEYIALAKSAMAELQSVKKNLHLTK